jgi:hypothetical protein
MLAHPALQHLKAVGLPPCTTVRHSSTATFVIWINDVASLHDQVFGISHLRALARLPRLTVLLLATKSGFSSALLFRLYFNIALRCSHVGAESIQRALDGQSHQFGAGTAGGKLALAASPQCARPRAGTTRQIQHSPFLL